MIEYVKYNYVDLLISLAFLLVIILLLAFLRTKRNRYRLGFRLNYILYKLGLRRRISGRYISKVHVKENYEHLVELMQHPKIIINKDTVESPVLFRKQVAMKIVRIAEKLPDNMYLKIYSAYRSRISLFEIWSNEINRLQSENPNIGRAELLSLVTTKVSNPYGSMGGHDTGGAVDLSLCDAEGNDIDFGSKYHERYIKRDLTTKQANNKKFLLKLMKSQGFVNHPNQWWHYSYGDKMWSAYKGKRLGGIYDSAEKEFEKAGFVRIIKTDIVSVNLK